ncbi:MAG: lysophospholipid acyltransferase family protein [Ilumatobacteraceae bacterium]
MRVSPTRRLLLGNPVSRTVLSVWGWLTIVALVIVWTALVFITWVVTAPFDRGRYWPGWVFRKVCVVHNWINPLWRFHTTGVKVDDPRHPYVVVSNHESFVDMLLISHLPWEMKWMSKDMLFKIPCLGWMMRMAGDIYLVRGSKASIVKAVQDSHDRLRKRVSVMMFPEGTRTGDGELGPFKDGAFRIAIDAQVPILPLVLNGTREALIKGDWRMNVTSAEVRVLEPIPTTGLTADDVAGLRDRTRQLIADELVKMRG